MTVFASTARQRDGRLWAIAFGLSLAVNAGLLGMVGFMSLKTENLRRSLPPAPVPRDTDRILTILPETLAAEPSSSPAVAAEPASPPPERPKFARTSKDQASVQEPETRAFIGERNTIATSDQTPVPDSPPLPSQAGVQKEYEDLETTESDYQDGSLADNPFANPDPTPPLPEHPAPAPTPESAIARTDLSGEKSAAPEKSENASSPPPAEKLLQSENPVDVPVPKEITDRSEIKSTQPQRPKEESASKAPSQLPKQAPAEPADQSGYRGNQRKSAIVGAISRTGRSSLDVADSPLGRYQSAISRAVEQEWQRNCVRHRDFITPGFLTVRFFVETTGKVRTVQFVGEMETGEVQKGFTLNSIRDAQIPPMPASVKNDYIKQPLELIFNFYF